MNLINVVIAAFLGYCLGCVQTAYLVGKLVRNIDIRKHGSNNAGASNVTSILGWRYGIITAVIDILKAVLAVVIIKLIFPEQFGLEFTAGAFVIVGHIFPFYLKFKGGKGAASLIGMFIAIDFKIALIIALILILITLITDYIAVGSILMFTATPLLVYLFHEFMLGVYICAGLLLICLFKHYINIVRILKGEEVGLRKVISKNKKNNTGLGI